MKPSRFQLSLAIAAGLHGGVWLARAAVREPAPPLPTVAMAYEEASVDIDVSQLSSSSPSGEQGSLGKLLSPRRGGSAAGRTGTHEDTGTPPDATGEASVPPPSGTVMSVWNTDAIAQRELGVGDTRGFAAPPPPPSEQEVVRDRIQRSLTDGLRDREVAAGGDPVSGPVARALTDATRDGLGPVNGRATFDAVINAAGMIVSIGTVDASSDRGAWDDIAKASAASLVGRQLRKSKNGVVVRIEITSREQLASGASPGHVADVSLPALNPVYVPDGTHANGGGNVIHGSFDVADIGSTARRIVAPRVTGIRDL